MKLILKNDWDTPINPPTEKKQQGHFIGRERELNLLVNEILRRNNGAILVSGYRGVGKTSLAYKALWEAKSQNENIITVLLNASQLEVESQEKEKIDPRWIIENLIRRLYSTTRERYLDKELKDKISKLYRKAVAEEFKLIESYQKQKEKSLEEIKEEKEELLFSGKDLRDIIFLFCWIISVFFLFGNVVIWNETINKILALLFFYPFPALFKYFYKEQKIKRDVEIAKGKVEELYEFDDKIANLEFDLEEIHRKFSENGKKLVYIIDELDKLETDQVIEVLKFFKNLFTLSNAIFIFVGGEDIYKIGIELKEGEVRENIYRSKEYTYFTSRYFLSRPLWKDLNRFLDEIIDEKEINEKGIEPHTLEKLKQAINFESKNDFFDLRKCIQDRITGFDKKYRPIIEVKQLSDNDIKGARLYKAITALLEDRYISLNFSKWEENERILRVIFDYTHRIYSSYSGVEFTDPNQNKVEDSVIRDLNQFLWRSNALNFRTETPMNIRGIQIPIRSYTYGGSIPIDPPDYFSEPTEIERRFINEFRNYGLYIITLNGVFKKARREKEISEVDFWNDPRPYVNQINEWGFDALNLFNSHLPVYRDLLNKNYSYRREDVEQRTDQIKNHISSLKQSLPTIFSRLLIVLNQDLNLQIQGLNDNSSLFSGSANEIRNTLTNINPLVVFKPDFSRQILLIHNQIEVLTKIKRHIRDNAKTNRIICFDENPTKEQIRGLHYINIQTPQILEKSLPTLLKNLNSFLRR